MTTSFVHLPKPSYLGPKKGRIPWERLWCPLGSSITLEAQGSRDENRTGFLHENEHGVNAQCLPLRTWYADHRLLILCGTPGSGKTDEIRAFCERIGGEAPEICVMAWSHEFLSEIGAIFEDPTWKRAQQEGREIVLLVDGFDQIRSQTGTPLGILVSALRGQNLRKVRLIVGCRASDWDSSIGETLLELWGAGGTTAVLEICPLRRSEVREAAVVSQVAPDAFLKAVHEKRFELQASWPLTLGPMLTRFAGRGDLPDSATEMMREAIDTLLKDPQGAKIKPFSSSLTQRRQLARRVAALQVCCGCRSVVKENVEAPTGVLAWADVVNTGKLGLESGELSDEVFRVTDEALRELCSTALFAVHSEDHSRVGFTHQAYAEFMAAEYLSGLSLDSLRQLLMVKTAAGEMVALPLGEVAAWLVAISQNAVWFDYLLDVNPEILVRTDGTALNREQKRRLIARLLDRAASEDALPFFEIHRLTPAFAFEGLAEALIPIILNRRAPALNRRLAIGIAEECKIGAVEEALWEVLAREDDHEPRPFLTRALRAILRAKSALDAETVSRLMKLVREEMGPDDDDDLKGLALSLLVPKYRKLRDIAPWLSRCKNESYIGSYARFLFKGLENKYGTGKEDLPALLECLLANHWYSDVGWHGRLAVQVLEMAIDNLDLPEVAKGVVALTRGCMASHCSLPLGRLNDELGRGKPVVPDASRRKLLRWLFNSFEWQPDHVFRLQRAAGIEHFDLAWLLEERKKAPESSRDLWLSCIRLGGHSEQERADCLASFLAAYAEDAGLREVFGECNPGMNIHETLVAHRKEREAVWEREAEKLAEGEEKYPSRQERLTLCLKGSESGDVTAWIHLCEAIFMPDSGEIFYLADNAIILSQGWAAMNEEERRQSKAAARAFLLERKDPSAGETSWRSTKGSWAAYFALELLSEDLEHDSELAEAAATKWVRAFIHEYPIVGEREEPVVKVLVARNPEGVAAAVTESLEQSNKAGSESQWALQKLANFWNSELSGPLVRFLKREDLHPNLFRSVIAFLSIRDLAATEEVLRHWLQRLAAGVLQEDTPLARVVLFAAALRTHGRLWEAATRWFHPGDQVRKIFLENSGAFGEPDEWRSKGNPLFEGLDEHALGHLCVWLNQHFPEVDRRSRGRGFTAVTSVDEMSDVRRMVNKVFAESASEAVVRKIREHLSPDAQLALSFSRGSALRQISTTEWEPETPASVLQLVREKDARLIRDVDDLFNFVANRLREYGRDSWELRIRPLWNEGKVLSDKHEEVLSDLLAGWLDEGGHLIVNREVQPVEIMPNRLDLKVQASGVPPVIVEVKKAHNREVTTSLQEQLVDRYLIPNRWTRGLYVVGWFGHKASVLGGQTPVQDEKKLKQMARKLRLPDHGRVDAIVIDCQHRQTSARKRSTHKRTGKRTSAGTADA